MSESELKREILETRNQMIKTDNHVTNLSLDIKAFEKRFDTLEKRARVATLGVHIMVAVVIGLAAFAITRAQWSSLKSTIAELEGRVAQAESEADQRIEAMRVRVTQVEQEKQRRAKASELANQILADLNAGREARALDAMTSLEMAALSPLERQAVEEPFTAAREEAAEDAYGAGKRSAESGRDAAAIKELSRSVALDPSGRYSDQARYLLVTALWRQGRYDQVGPLIDALEKTQKDRNLLEELTFIRASALAHAGKKEEAKTLFEKLSRTRYATSSKAYLTAIEVGGELPAVPGAQ